MIAALLLISGCYMAPAFASHHVADQRLRETVVAGERGLPKVKAGPPTCGTERWAAKILSDPAAARISLATKITTIAALNALPKGCSKGENERSGIELQVYRVTGLVNLVRREKDGDFHIVLSDGKGHTVVVESPSPACARRSHFRSVITAAREACALFKPGQVVTVEGPAFYDFFHGQTGMSRSCVELHPVMWVR